MQVLIAVHVSEIEMHRNLIGSDFSLCVIPKITVRLIITETLDLIKDTVSHRVISRLKTPYSFHAGQEPEFSRCLTQPYMSGPGYPPTSTLSPRLTPLQPPWHPCVPPAPWLTHPAPVFLPRHLHHEASSDCAFKTEVPCHGRTPVFTLGVDSEPAPPVNPPCL